jgi:hypothetical protein
MLAMLVSRARNSGQINGVVPHLIDEGLSVIFLENDLEQAKNLNLVSCAFEKNSCLKINFHESELFSLGEAKNNAPDYIQSFDCKEGAFSF